MKFSSVARVLSFASFCLVVGFAHLSAQEEKVDVDASFTGGTYSSPIKVELKATQDDAKIFYSFNPDGTPDETHTYTGGLFLTKDTPLVFFAIISNQNDSKIKINQYHFSYATGITLSATGALRLSQAINNLAITNTSSGAANIGWWKVKVGDNEKIIDENTILNAGSTYVVDSIPFTGDNMDIVLYSPDEKEQARIAMPAMAQDIQVKPVDKPKEAYVPIVEPHTQKNTEEKKSEAPATPAPTEKQTNTNSAPTSSVVNTPTAPATTPSETTSTPTPSTQNAQPSENTTTTTTPTTPAVDTATEAKSAEAIAPTPVPANSDTNTADSMKISSVDTSSSFPIIPTVIILALLSILVRSALAIRARK